MINLQNELICLQLFSTHDSKTISWFIGYFWPKMIKESEVISSELRFAEDLTGEARSESWQI